jgi:hypothetical protein
MAQESRNLSLLGNGSVNPFPGNQMRNNRRAVFCMWSRLLNIREVVFSTCSMPRGYKKDKGGGRLS